MMLSHGALWMVVGLGVAALEMLAPGFFLLWVGLAALGTGVAAEVLDLGLSAQVAVFVGLSVALVGGVGVRLRRRAPLDSVNAPAAGLIGQTCRAVGFRDGEGRVTLGDGMWPARLAEGTEPAEGAALRVVGLDGTTLLVSPRA